MVRERIKKIFPILGIICLVLLNSGYTYPDNSPYIRISTNAGDFTVHFATNNNTQYLSYDEEGRKLINTSSNTIYGYTSYQGSDVRINFPTYDTPYISVSYQNTVYLNAIEIIENYNVSLYSPFNANLETYAIIVIIFLLFFLFFKR